MDNPLAGGSTMDILHNRGRSIDAQVDAATGGVPTGAAPSPSPDAAPEPGVSSRPTMDRATGVPGESSHNPDNRLPGGPSMMHAVRGFIKNL